jgi:hypothetical protein
MKRYLVAIIAVISLAMANPIASYAQPGSTGQNAKLLTTTSYGNTLDTVVNAATKVTTPADGRTSNWNVGLNAQVVVTKISGTVGGSIALQGSMDGTNWSLIGSATTPSDATANYTFNTTVRWPYFRISYAGTGTMSASFKASFLWY